MRISSDRAYRFDVTPAVLWSAIGNVDDFPRWWPWLRRFDGTGIETGDVWHCTVQPPLPYTLSFDIAIGDVVPHERVTAHISGEISGTAELTIEPTVTGCEARLTSRLAPSSRFLQAIAMVARPVVTMGHDWVLDTGARQFRKSLG